MNNFPCLHTSQTLRKMLIKVCIIYSWHSDVGQSVKQNGQLQDSMSISFYIFSHLTVLYFLPPVLFSVVRYRTKYTGFSFKWEKEGDLTQSCEKIPMPTANWKTNGQPKNATKNLYYKTTADRLRTVSWSSNYHTAGVVKPVLGYPTFPVYYTMPFGFNLFWHFLGISFQLLKILPLAKDYWRGFSTWNAHMVHIVN